jgi:hypothetical protein
MPPSTRYDPLPRSSSEEFDLDNTDFKPRRPYSRPASSPFNTSYFLACVRKTRRICRLSYLLIAFTALFIAQITLNTSYLYPPPFDVPANETVFIAANIVDAELINGAWGQSLIDLVELIGPEKVHVSIYGGPPDALQGLEKRLPCEKSIVSEKAEPVDLEALPRTQLYTSRPRIKRIAFLAEARNRALKPLDTLNKPFSRILFLNDVFFNPADAVRLLWGTNVDANTGRASYQAACGTDFIESWKYYDTFATRDTDGFSMGLPVFPWFSSAGEGVSRRDVLDQKSAVRVKSCWGGIVAFDARYFQKAAVVERDEAETSKTETKDNSDNTVTAPSTPALPIRFRSVAEPYWEASECCLVHADLMAVTPPSDDWGKGIFMNPYVRVSYDAVSFSRLWIAHRFERLATIPQRIISYFAALPRPNLRRTEKEGDVVREKIWAPKNSKSKSKSEGEDSSGQEVRDDERRELDSYHQPHRRAHYIYDPADFWHRNGYFVEHTRTAERGGYCGVRALLVLREGRWEHSNWEVLDSAIPPTESEF